MLFICQAGFEALLARELAEGFGLAAIEQGPGWVLVAAGQGRAVLSDAAFPQIVLASPEEVRGDSVNQVKGARKCAISNQGGIMHTHSTLILGQA